jgi:hypothetical protein
MYSSEVSQSKQVQPVTSLQSLLDRLEENLSNYYSYLTQLSVVTEGVEAKASIPENIEKECRPQRFNNGTLYRFDNLNKILEDINKQFAEELSKLQQHI